MAQLRRTPLYDRHVHLGAKMVEFGGWEMPLNYAGGIFEEHLATRRGAGLFDVSHMGRFVFRGAGALAFLQHALANNAAALDVGRAQYTMIPDAAGGAVDDAYLYRFVEEEYLLVVNAANRAKDWDHFQSLLPGFAGVEMIDRSEELAMISLQGPRSREIMEGVLAKPELPEPRRNALGIGTIGGARILIGRTGYTGEPLCFEIFVTSTDAPRIWDLLCSRGAAPVGLGARDTLRLEAGLPLYGHELGSDPEGKTIPIFACPLAKFAVSFSPLKGDFVARTPLERQHAAYRRIVLGDSSGPGDPSGNLSDLPRVIVPVAILGKAVARAGAKVFTPDGSRQVGWITSGTAVPYWKWQDEGLASRLTDEKGMRSIALALLDCDLPMGARLSVDVRGRPAEAVIVPYHLRSEAPPYARPTLCCSTGILPVCTTGVPPVRVAGILPARVPPLRVAGILPARTEGVPPSASSVSSSSSSVHSSSAASPAMSSSASSTGWNRTRIEEEQEETTEGETPSAHEGKMPSPRAGETPATHVSRLLEDAIANTLWRQRECINLIPSEMTASPMVRLLSAMDPSFRYAEHKAVRAFDDAEVFYYQGTDFIHRVEEALEAELRRYLGCSQVETRVLSGQMANAVVFSAMVDYLNHDNRRAEPRRIRCVMNHGILRGGHLSSQPMGALRDFVARDGQTEMPAAVNFPVRSDNPFQIDVPACRPLLEKHRPELIIFGKSLVLDPEPLAEIRTMVRELGTGSTLMYDMAHVLGLAGPHFQEPFVDGADLVTGSTHKTFFGTQRGIVAANWPMEDRHWELWEAVRRRTFPGAVSNHHLGTMLGLLMAAYEMNHFRSEYQPAVLANAKAFATALAACGLEVAGDKAGGYTQTHQVLLHVGYGKGPEVARRLEESNIIVNYQAGPSEEGFTAAGYLRMGVAEMTRFGMKEADFGDLAQLLRDAIAGAPGVADKVKALRRRFLQLRFCFEGKQHEQAMQKMHGLIG